MKVAFLFYFSKEQGRILNKEVQESLQLPQLHTPCGCKNIVISCVFICICCMWEAGNKLVKTMTKSSQN